MKKVLEMIDPAIVRANEEGMRAQRRVGRVNLNDVRIEDHSGDHTAPPRRIGDERGGAVSRDGRAAVFFTDLADHLIEQINGAQIVVGCVAWLTDRRILAALAGRERVAVVVQKEDFLRPDVDAPSDWRWRLRADYERLPNGTRWEFGLGHLSSGGDDTLAAVRCAGPVSTGHRVPAARMHHKFLVFGSVSADYKSRSMGESILNPAAVWTGSFNATVNASDSLENAVLLKDGEIVEAYVREWMAMETLSEPLDWDSEWVEPEWRIGT